MAIQTITLGFIVALLSSLVGIIYVYFYYQLFDFSSYLPIWKIPAIFTFFSFLIVALSLTNNTLFKKRGNIITSLFVAISSILSISAPLLFPPKFSDEIEVPELFPALVFPLHFFVPLFWLFLSPYFLISKQ
ncbi:MAG: hypothetical protein FJX84_07305 [Bacteroidetes bacterium]|nr:hypothetical protein [Bacteroidota bacterium]